MIAAVARLIRSDRCVYLNCRKLRDSRTIRMKGILTELSKTFDDAYIVAPCIVILDDLDLLVPNFGTGSLAYKSSQMYEVDQTEIDQSKLISDVLGHLMRSKKNGIFVAITSQTPQSLSQLLLSEGNFCHHVAVPSLNGNDRENLYRNFLRKLCPLALWSSDSNFIRKTFGFRPRDLEQLAIRVNHLELLNRNDAKFNVNHATSKALDHYKPLSRLDLLRETTCDNANKLCNIGGLRQAKADLVSTIVRPSQYRRIYDQAKVRLPRGVLLYGFPGTGKSLSIPALARECGYPLIVCRGPELLDKYIGASEAKVRELFTRAATAAPSIMFIDELDALAPRRGSDHTGVTDRIVNQLLTFLDGVEDVGTDNNSPVYVIGATSRPDKVDPALLRPGRLEKHIYFGLSNEVEEVKDLLLKISDHYSLDPLARIALESGELVRKVSSLNPKFRYFSAADFTSMFHSAQLMAVHKALDLGGTTGTDTAVIGSDDLYEAVMSARPSLSEEDYYRLSDIYNSYRHGKTLLSSLNNLQTALK
jgi:peroxin-1